MSEQLSDQRLAEIRERHEAATKGPYWWQGFKGSGGLHLMGNRWLVVMDFVRWGMQNAQPRFRNHSDNLLYNAVDLLRTKGCNDRITGIDHPDAEALAHSWEDVDVLLSEVERLRSEIKTLKGHINE